MILSLLYSFSLNKIVLSFQWSDCLVLHNTCLSLRRSCTFSWMKSDLFFTAEGHSIHVRNLPYDATVGQLEKEFKKFGPIKRDGIQVRSSKVCFICMMHFLIQLRML